MYDRVTVVDIAGDKLSWLMTMNAAGSNSLFADGSTLRWSDALKDEADPADWIRQVERRCGLPVPTKPLPSATSMSLVPRFVAQFLTLQLGGRVKWHASRLGNLDGPPAWHHRMAADMEREGRDPHLHLTFLHRHGVMEPDVGFSSTGELRRRDGRRFTLKDLHRSGAPVIELLLKTVPDLLA